MTDIDTTECDRLVAVADDSHKLGEFLDWLNEQDIHLGEYQENEYGHEELMTRHEPYERLLARYFEIDLDKVEQERRAILESLR